MTTLATLQVALAAAVLARPGTPTPDPRFRHRGLAVYREAYRLRLMEVMQADFPMLVRVLGDDGFATLASSYIETHRSTHFSVRWFARAFPRHVLRNEAPTSRRLLAEIACLEWLLGEAFDAADAGTVGPQALAAIAPQSWPTACLCFHPSVRLLRVHAGTLAWWIWARDGAVESDRPSLTLSSGESASTLVIWRVDTLVRYRVLEPTSALALRSALRGAQVGALCADLAAHHHPAEIPKLIARLLSEWLSSGLVSEVHGDG